MKKQIIVFMLCLSILQLTSCRTIETQSTPRHYKIVLSENNNDSVKLFINTGAGQYDEILPVENIFTVDIPAMCGGYSEFLGIEFNKHIPEEYKVVKIMKGEKIIKEFSILEIEQLKKDKEGYYLLGCNSPTDKGNVENKTSIPAKYIILADSTAKKMLNEFNKSDEAKQLGGPFLFEDYSKKLTTDTINNRPTLIVDYEYQKLVGFLGHPQHFGYWVYLDNCEIKFFGGE